MQISIQIHEEKRVALIKKRAALFQKREEKRVALFLFGSLPRQLFLFGHFLFGVPLDSCDFFEKFEMTFIDNREFERVSARISGAFWLKLCACVGVNGGRMNDNLCRS